MFGAIPVSLVTQGLNFMGFELLPRYPHEIAVLGTEFHVFTFRLRNEIDTQECRLYTVNAPKPDIGYAQHPNRETGFFHDFAMQACHRIFVHFKPSPRRRQRVRRISAPQQQQLIVMKNVCCGSDPMCRLERDPYAPTGTAECCFSC